MSFRGFLMWVHLILGLTGSVIIVILGVTGAYITIQPVLVRWVNPVPAVAPAPRLDPGRMVAAAEARFPGERAMRLDYRQPDEAAVVTLRSRTAVFVDPSTAEVLGSRPRRAISLQNLNAVMRGLHVQLLLPRGGQLLVTLVTAEALLLVFTGIWLWWRKKAWRFGPLRGSWFRVSWDLHSASGIWFAVPVAVMALTGVLIFWPAPLARLTGTPLTPWRFDPSSQVPAAGDRPPIPLSRVLAVADSLLPGVAVDWLAIPSGPAGSFGVRKGTETVFVDQYSGALIERRTDQEPTRADRALHASEGAHSGELFGPAGQVVMTLGSLMLAIMAITGLVLGWKRLQILAGRRPRDAD